MRNRRGDINRILIQTLNTYRNAITKGDLLQAWSILDGWNRLLPSEPDPDDPSLRKYGIIVNTTIYNQHVRKNKMAECPTPTCKGRYGVLFDQKQMGVRNLEFRERNWSNSLPYSMMPLQVRTWTCPICKKTHDAEHYDGRPKVEIAEPEESEPITRKVVPKPPNAAQYPGVGGRAVWEFQLKGWLSVFFGELMSETTRYREDMIKTGRMMDDDADAGDYSEVEA